MKAAQVIGIARVVMHTKERLAALIPDGDAMLLNTIRWAEELRPARRDRLSSGRQGRGQAQGGRAQDGVQLVRDMTGKWNPNDYADKFTTAIHALAAQRVKAGKTEKVTPLEDAGAASSRGNVVDLTELLKKSLATRKSGGDATTRATPAAAAAKKSRRRRARGKGSEERCVGEGKACGLSVDVSGASLAVAGAGDLSLAKPSALARGGRVLSRPGDGLADRLAQRPERIGFVHRRDRLSGAIRLRRRRAALGRHRSRRSVATLRASRRRRTVLDAGRSVPRRHRCGAGAALRRAVSPPVGRLPARHRRSSGWRERSSRVSWVRPRGDRGKCVLPFRGRDVGRSRVVGPAALAGATIAATVTAPMSRARIAGRALPSSPRWSCWRCCSSRGGWRR
jgi:hypothetical protein